MSRRRRILGALGAAALGVVGAVVWAATERPLPRLAPLPVQPIRDADSWVAQRIEADLDAGVWPVATWRLRPTGGGSRRRRVRLRPWLRGVSGRASTPWTASRSSGAPTCSMSASPAMGWTAPPTPRPPPGLRPHPLRGPGRRALAGGEGRPRGQLHRRDGGHLGSRRPSRSRWTPSCSAPRPCSPSPTPSPSPCSPGGRPPAGAHRRPGADPGRGLDSGPRGADGRGLQRPLAHRAGHRRPHPPRGPPPGRGAGGSSRRSRLPPSSCTTTRTRRTRMTWSASPPCGPGAGWAGTPTAGWSPSRTGTTSSPAPGSGRTSARSWRPSRASSRRRSARLRSRRRPPRRGRPAGAEGSE